MSDLKTYLGDGVYGDFDGERITLTTEDGYSTTNTIVLEPEVFTALFNYASGSTRLFRATNLSDESAIRNPQSEIITMSG